MSVIYHHTRASMNLWIFFMRNIDLVFNFAYDYWSSAKSVNSFFNVLDNGYCKLDNGGVDAIKQVDKCRYPQSMHNLIEDFSKFVPLSKNTRNNALKIKDIFNKSLRKLKETNALAYDIYKILYVTCSALRVVYCLPKVHKPNFSDLFQSSSIFAPYNAIS